MNPVIPKKTVYRLSVYLRCLDHLNESGVQTVSSQMLAESAGVKSTQLRKDLTFFGHFGTRGLGYNVNRLRDKITEVLGRKTLQPVVLVGVGNLGAALLSYKGFEKEGFEVVAGFDMDLKRHRRRTFRQPVLHLDKLEQFVRRRHIRLGIITVPPAAAQSVANRLIGAGV